MKGLTRARIIKEAERRGLKVLSVEEHRELVKGKKIVFSKQALKDAEWIVKEIVETTSQDGGVK